MFELIDGLLTRGELVADHELYGDVDMIIGSGDEGIDMIIDAGGLDLLSPRSLSDL